MRTICSTAGSKARNPKVRNPNQGRMAKSEWENGFVSPVRARKPHARTGGRVGSLGGLVLDHSSSSFRYERSGAVRGIGLYISPRVARNDQKIRDLRNRNRGFCGDNGKKIFYFVPVAQHGRATWVGSRGCGLRGVACGEGCAVSAAGPIFHHGATEITEQEHSAQGIPPAVSIRARHSRKVSRGNTSPARQEKSGSG